MKDTEAKASREVDMAEHRPYTEPSNILVVNSTYFITPYSLDALSSSQRLELHSTAEHLAEIKT